jgi:hypothetical protein
MPVVDPAGWRVRYALWQPDRLICVKCLLLGLAASVACGNGGHSRVDAKGAAVDAIAPDCTWTVEGGAGTSESGGSCTFQVTAVSGLQCALDGIGGGYPDLTFTASLLDQTTLVPGVYTVGDASGSWDPHTGYEVIYGWAMCMGSICTASKPAQGSFTLTISDSGPDDGGGVWSGVTGSLTLVMPGAFATAAHSTAQVDVNFGTN